MKTNKIKIDLKDGSYKVFDVPSFLDIEMVTKVLKEEQDRMDKKAVSIDMMDGFK